MKKGLFLTLVFAVAMLSSSVFANAPLISDVPDIVIGDIEDNYTSGTETIDINFFVFSNAFVFDEYVTDPDTTESLLKWSFAKVGATPANDITINGQNPEASNFLNPTAELRGVADTASLRNITLSPVGPNFFPTPPNPSYVENIVFYVSDTVNSDSTEVDVYTVDGAEDGFSVGIPPIWSETWDTQGTWRAYNGSWATTTVGAYDSAARALRYTVADFNDTTNTWGSNWYQYQYVVDPSNLMLGLVSPITYQAGNVYAVKATIRATSDSASPSVRMLVGDSNNTFAAIATYDYETVGVGGAAGATSKPYMLLFEPVATTSPMFVHFDIFTPKVNGSFWIEEVSAYRIPVAQVVTTGTPTAVTNFTAWGARGETAPITIGSTNITIADATAWASSGGYITFTSPIASGKYYKVAWTMRNGGNGTGGTDGIRVYTSDAMNGNYTNMFVFIKSNILTTTATAYNTYHSAYNGRRLSPSADLTAFFETINDHADAEDAVLSSVVFNEITIPPLQ